LFLDANFGIDIWFTDAVRAQKALRPLRGTITEDSYGKEGFIVLAVPIKVHKNRPDFAFLEQPSLAREEVKSRDVRTRDAGAAAKTPFEQLLAAVAFGMPGTRSADRDVPTNPTTLLRSWITLPGGKGGAPKQP
jgi:hypothetical protein